MTKSDDFCILAEEKIFHFWKHHTIKYSATQSPMSVPTELGHNGLRSWDIETKTYLFKKPNVSKHATTKVQGQAFSITTLQLPNETAQ